MRRGLHYDQSRYLAAAESLEDHGIQVLQRRPELKPIWMPCDDRCAVYLATVDYGDGPRADYTGQTRRPELEKGVMARLSEHRNRSTWRKYMWSQYAVWPLGVRVDKDQLDAAEWLIASYFGVPPGVRRLPRGMERLSVG
jgi:hypothetical protein